MKRLLLVTLLSVLLFGCGTFVPVEVMKPSEVNMGAMRKIAILNFGYPDLGYGDATADTIIRNTVSRYLGYTYNRSSEQESVAKYATDKFISLLIGTNYFTILDPGNVEGAIRKANRISLSPTELGDILGADALITGSIGYLNIKITEEKIPIKDPKGVINSYSSSYIKKAGIQLNYRVLNAKTGELVATKQFSGDKTSDKSIDYGKLPDNVQMYQELLDSLLYGLPKQLVPYKVTESRQLMADETKNPDMEKMNDLVNKKFYKDALDGFLKIWRGEANAAAGYNAAIMLEITGDMDGAIALMTQVADKTKNERALREIDRLNKTKQESEAASKQL